MSMGRDAIGTKEVDPFEAASLVESGAFLLDVREHHEWRAGHAPGAAHIPLGELPARVGELPGEEQVVVVCRSGARSLVATEALVGAGYAACNLVGGMQAWAGAGLAVVTDDGAGGLVA